MTLTQLRYIVMVAQKGTISEAAKALFISQPSLTTAIKDLEKEMQITIFNRTNKGVFLTNEGDTFLGYARQVLEQADLLEEKYKHEMPKNPIFSVSCQHYSFAVHAFVQLIQHFGYDEYDFTLRETQTYEIIEDVQKRKSEIGILYISKENERVLKKMIHQNGLEFHSLFVAKPHVFLSSKHPLVDKTTLTIADLENYPYLSFEQGEYNSFYFSEELLSTLERKKKIKVRDRATLFNLAIGLDGYTISSGIIDQDINGSNIVSIPLESNEQMNVGYIMIKNASLSRYGQVYIEALEQYIEK